MRLSKDDRYELARAAIKAPDLQSLRNYIISLIDAFDERPDGKTEVQCPRFTEPAADGHAPKPPPNGSRWEEALL